MKKRPLLFSLLAIALTSSFFLSKVRDNDISALVVIASVFHFVVAGYISLVTHHLDLQQYLIKPERFDEGIIAVFILFLISIFSGGYFSSSEYFISPFASAFGLLIGILVGGITAHKLEGKKITNWVLFKFKPKFIF